VGVDSIHRHSDFSPESSFLEPQAVLQIESLIPIRSDGNRDSEIIKIAERARGGGVFVFHFFFFHRQIKQANSG
jgi:hypothetical protein